MRYPFATAIVALSTAFAQSNDNLGRYERYFTESLRFELDLREHFGFDSFTADNTARADNYTLQTPSYADVKRYCAG